MKLLFRLLLLSACCRLSVLVSEEPEVIGSHVPIQAAVGEDVILPCHLEPPFDVHNLTVEWRHNKTTVHMYRSLADDPDSQDESFRNRTRLFHDEMVKGNISLKLSNVTEQDKGIYICFVPNLHSQVKKGNISLEVVQKREEGEIKGDPTSGPGTTTHKNLSPAEITGIVLGVIAFAIGIGIVIVINCRREQRQRNLDAARPEELENL